jgi:hypothetical protein
MLRLLKDPLIHFLLLGGLLFALYSWRGEPEGLDPYQIVISDDEVQSMWQALAILGGHAPTRDEIWGAIEPTIREEILYREAVALGLDRDDSQVRLRLVEKMLFLTQDVAEPVAPAAAEVAAFFETDPGRVRLPATWSFEQIFFSVSQHGAQLAGVVDDALAALRAGDTDSVAGDELLFERRYLGRDLSEIERVFGEEFATAIEATEPGSDWQGPLRSNFGLHIVRVTEFVESRQPAFDEIRADVLSALVEQRRSEANAAEYQKLRDRYEIVVNLPEPTDDAAGAAEAAE